MNFPKAFESALAAAIVENAPWTEQPQIRTWQALDADARWSTLADRDFPQVELRASTPVTDPDTGYTQMCAVRITIGTQANDDQDHSKLADIYSAVATVMEKIYSQFLARVAGAERNSFDRNLSNASPDENEILNVGGFTFGDAEEPYEESGANYITILFRIHYSRTDY